MKILLILLGITIVATSCNKHIDNKEDAGINPPSYGFVDTPTLIELTARDTLNLTANSIYPNFISKLVFKKELFDYKPETDSIYSKGFVQIGSLIQNSNDYYELIGNNNIDLIDTNSVIKKDSVSITYGINNKLIGKPIFSIYHYGVNRVYMLLIASMLSVNIKVSYKGTLDAKEVAKYYNSYSMIHINYSWIR